MTEKEALARTLCIAKAAYSAISEGEQLNAPALLDGISAALSHVNHDKKPLAKCLRILRSEIKSKNKDFYLGVKKYFSKLYPMIGFDFKKSVRHLPAVIYGNDRICEKLIKGQNDKARSMADAMKSYPGFLFGEFEALSDEQFYDLVFGFYPKLYDEPFMDEMREHFLTEDR